MEKVQFIDVKGNKNMNKSLGLYNIIDTLNINKSIENVPKIIKLF